MSGWADFKRGLPVFLREDALPGAKKILPHLLITLFVAWLVVAALWVTHVSSAPAWETALGILFFVALFAAIATLFVQHVMELGKKRE